MNPTSYELAVAEYLRLLYPEPEFLVRHDIRMAGKLSGGPRQIDVAVFSPPDPEPIFIAEAKKHRRRIDVGTAGMVISLVRDVGSVPSVLVATTGFSSAAQRYLAHEGIQHLAITISRAECLRWVSDLQARFRGDAEFMEVSGSLVEAIRKKDPTPFLDCDIPYEEWLAVADLGFSRFATNAAEVFSVIAREHYDDGHRFNAIQILHDRNLLSTAAAVTLMKNEADPDTRELLEEIVAFRDRDQFGY